MSVARTIRRQQERVLAKGTRKADKQRERIRSYFSLLYTEMQNVPQDHPYRAQIEEGLTQMRGIMAWWIMPTLAAEPPKPGVETPIEAK